MKISIRFLSANSRNYSEFESVQKRIFVDSSETEFKWIQARGESKQDWILGRTISSLSRNLAIGLNFLPNRREIAVPVFRPDLITRWAFRASSLSTFTHSEENRTIVFTGLPESFSTVSLKTILDLKLALEGDFDFLVRANSSTFLNVEALKEVLRKSPRKRLYAGPIQQLLDLTYVSGSLIVMSRDVVEGILDNWASYRVEQMDDVAIGLLIRDAGLAIPEHLERFEYPQRGKGVELNSRQLNSPAYRCKATNAALQIARFEYLASATGTKE